jgi:hypothetical protein
VSGQTARKEFENVKRQRIPPQARETVDRYLSAIAAAETTRVQAYFEAGFGSDSNVNSATDSSQISLPALGGIIATLNPGATQDSDTFTSLAGGGGQFHAQAERDLVCSRQCIGPRRLLSTRDRLQSPDRRR